MEVIDVPHQDVVSFFLEMLKYEVASIVLKQVKTKYKGNDDILKNEKTTLNSRTTISRY